MKHGIHQAVVIVAAFAMLLVIGAPARAAERQTSTQAAEQQAALAYRFTVISSSAYGFDPFEYGCAAINDKGQVAFRATRVNGVTIIARGEGRGLDIIASSRNRFGFVGFNPSINNQGQVSFAAGLDAGGEAIFRGSGNALTTIARTEPGRYNFFGFDTAINNRGAVAFKAELDDTFAQGLFVGNGRSTRTYYLSSSSPFGGSNDGPSINDHGQVAFFEYLDTDGQGIFRSNGRSFATIAENSGPLDSLSYPSINTEGLVAFQATFDDGGEAIFTGNGGGLTTVASTEGPISSFSFGGPALNDRGVLAFAASLDDGDQGLFIGSDPGTGRVIGIGDALAGSTVTNVVFCREGQNNTGALAFQAQLEDGRTVIARAEPRHRGLDD